MNYPWQDPKQAAAAAYQRGVAETQQRYETGFRQAIEHFRQEFDQKLNRTAGGLRKASDEQVRSVISSVDERLANLAKIAESLQVMSSGRSSAGDVYVEDIPGGRIPYIYLVEIPIQSGDPNTREGLITVSMNAPFVVERRWCTFLSAHEFQFTDEESGAIVKFPGRSYGRYRPAHSASDINDSIHNAIAGTVAWLGTVPAAGGVMPAGVLALPSAASSFRTMEFDGVIEMEDAGSNWGRQNRPAPTAFWSAENNGPVPWSCLDFFERGSAITIRVKPNHLSNPPAGNVTGAAVFPNAAAIDGYPFADGQYDPHEGIATREAVTVGAEGEGDYTPIETDPIQRLPDGYFIAALEGFRIAQPTGPVL